MTDETERILHFTLGPVQGFVAQARRTRDLWSGSFLLSYLVGEAMRCVIEARGEIILPKVGNGREITDPLFKALLNQGVWSDHEHKPIQGSLPNRFKARISANFDPGKCVEAVRVRWKAIAQVVWDEFLHPLWENVVSRELDSEQRQRMEVERQAKLAQLEKGKACFQLRTETGFLFV